ncbi:hypothetical protein KAK06_16565 [Ideonella sp. 4Y11]|uniref:Tetratricopeptide repeat-like domain-containing protein n=1 Tax=Ideonella aquatica TaxID=2824119 RepID=A0A941BM88_9BURK|nr:hypothetical protein [Ideonella aquatica]MBQ0960569.1 hypothetical protein [Ideonella aquatica]
MRSRGFHLADPRDRRGSESLLILIKMLDERLDALERQDRGSMLKRLTENAGAVALALGLILTCASLYDVFVRKPEADRISTLAQFNQAVNSAVKTRQELVQQSQAGDPTTRMTLASLATPRILNDLSTAKAVLPELDDKDVGVPQLLTLISESMTAGDLATTGYFVQRAVRKTDVSPLMQSEARRYEGKYLHSIGQHEAGRQAYERAIALIGDAPAAAGARAYALADMLTMDFAYGSCQKVDDDIQHLHTLLRAQMIPGDMRMQISASVISSIQQFQGKLCPIPTKIGLMQPG